MDDSDALHGTGWPSSHGHDPSTSFSSDHHHSTSTPPTDSYHNRNPYNDHYHSMHGYHDRYKEDSYGPHRWDWQANKYSSDTSPSWWEAATDLVFKNSYEDLIGYLGLGLLMVFFVYCLAAGLYALAELVESNLRTTKTLIRLAILTTAALTALLGPINGTPWLLVLLTLAAQAAYFPLLKPFPFIALTDLRLLLAGGLSVTTHFCWLKHFLDMHTMYRPVSLPGLFILLIWLLPFCMLISLAANEHILPGGASGMPTAFIHHAGSGTGHSSGYGIGGGAGGGKVQQQRAGRTLLASWLGRLQAGVGSCLPGASQRGAGAGRVD